VSLADVFPADHGDLTAARAEVARLREALEHIHTIASSVLHGAATGQQAGISPWNMTVGTKREILRTIDAALTAKEADRG
jgi:hypothetical protein